MSRKDGTNPALLYEAGSATGLICIKAVQIARQLLSMPHRDEDSIKADLRELTAKTRKLREELGGMVTAPSKDLSRALIHTQSWPKDRRTASAPVANDRRRPPRKTADGPDTEPGPDPEPEDGSR
jgi:hypothetical protein